MIVHTVQPLSIYWLMRDQGYYEGSSKYVCEDFKKPYDWMKAQMMDRIPDYQGSSYPVWVWKRTVNRNEECLLPTGQRGVILTLDIPDQQILWSCFESWHCILNDSPVTLNEAEWEKYDRENWANMQETWPRIFDFDLLKTIDPEWHNFDDNWVQGVTPKITMDQVKKVKRFIAK
ncbi:hypothetical protein A374_03894 [Fictibacillus macauensis ZFHKF-1]|uniref:DUF3841 domain-containing protein n=1 Tax=Fictibacillus macauensis ZFHKF-1 TaxID=1196324 RepID=I8UIM5_9BACL|nr:DUF3841 domain-containing protein [Fictibacillus macauensis]EIT86683.1 hypothetical protein A374_03894 [Fictibacillus macauensis ZFHKF-1]